MNYEFHKGEIKGSNEIIDLKNIGLTIDYDNIFNSFSHYYSGDNAAETLSGKIRKLLLNHEILRYVTYLW